MRILHVVVLRRFELCIKQIIQDWYSARENWLQVHPWWQRPLWNKENCVPTSNLMFYISLLFVCNFNSHDFFSSSDGLYTCNAWFFFQLNSATEHKTETRVSMSPNWRRELREKINANLQSNKVIWVMVENVLVYIHALYCVIVIVSKIGQHI